MNGWRIEQRADPQQGHRVSVSWGHERVRKGTWKVLQSQRVVPPSLTPSALSLGSLGKIHRLP